jgi:hypothetical protein
LHSYYLDLWLWKDRTKGDGSIWLELQHELMEKGEPQVVMLALRRKNLIMSNLAILFDVVLNSLDQVILYSCCSVMCLNWVMEAS